MAWAVYVLQEDQGYDRDAPVQVEDKSSLEYAAGQDQPEEEEEGREGKDQGQQQQQQDRGQEEQQQEGGDEEMEEGAGEEEEEQDWGDYPDRCARMPGSLPSHNLCYVTVGHICTSWPACGQESSGSECSTAGLVCALPGVFAQVSGHGRSVAWHAACSAPASGGDGHPAEKNWDLKPLPCCPAVCPPLLLCHPPQPDPLLHPPCVRRAQPEGHVQPEGPEPEFELPEDLNLDGGEAMEEEEEQQGQQEGEEQQQQVGSFPPPSPPSVGPLAGVLQLWAPCLPEGCYMFCCIEAAARVHSAAVPGQDCTLPRSFG